MKKIYVDMDGTIANLYGVDDWLECLKKEMVMPYVVAKPLYKSDDLRTKMVDLIAKGFTFVILSWTSKGASDDYAKEIAKAKEHWLKRENLDDLFAEKLIVAYGTSKQEIVGDDYLIDDEDKNLVGLANGKKTNGDDLLTILEEIG